MNTRVLAAAVAGGAALFLFGFLIYGLVLEPMVMKPNMITYPGLTKDPPDWIPLILANLVNGFLLAYVFDKWAAIRTFIGGASAGAILMFLIALTIQLFFASFMNISRNFIPAIADVLGSTVLGAIGGGVVGAVLGVMKNDSAPAAV